MKYEYLKPIGGGFFLARETGKSLMVIDEQEVPFFKKVHNAAMVSEHYMLVSSIREAAHFIDAGETAQLIDIRDWHVVKDNIVDWQLMKGWGAQYPNGHGFSIQFDNKSELSRNIEQPLHSYFGYHTEMGETGVFKTENESFITDILMAWNCEGSLQSIKQEGRTIAFPNGTSLTLKEGEEIRHLKLALHHAIGTTTHNFFVFDTYSTEPPRWISKDSEHPVTWNRTNHSALLIFQYDYKQIFFDTSTNREIHFDQPIKLLSSFVAQSNAQNIEEETVCVFMMTSQSAFIYKPSIEDIVPLSGKEPTVTYM